MALMYQSPMTFTVKPPACYLVGSSSRSSNGGMVSGFTLRITGTPKLGTRLRLRSRSSRNFTAVAIFEEVGSLGGPATSIPTFETVREEIDKKFKKVVNDPEIQKRFHDLKRAVVISKAKNAEDLKPMLRHLYINQKKLVQYKLAMALLSTGFVDPTGVETIARALAKKIYTVDFEVAMGELVRDISDRVEFLRSKSPGLEREFELWNNEVKKVRYEPTLESKLWLEARARQIRRTVSKALESLEFNEEYKRASYEKWIAEREQHYR